MRISNPSVVGSNPSVEVDPALCELNWNDSEGVNASFAVAGKSEN
jgi:hypothetical protein